MSRRQRRSAKLRGRTPKVPTQRTQAEQVFNPYGGFIPFLQIQGKKVTPIRPDAKRIRAWSRNNPVVRRCVDIITDRIAQYPIRFDVNDGKNHDKELAAVKYSWQHPNTKDDEGSFRSQVTEDLVVGDCGVWEIRKTSDTDRPFFLYPTDGFTMSFVLDGQGSDIGYMQKVTDNIQSVPENYVPFKNDEIIYLKKHAVTNTPYGLSPIEVAFKQIKVLTDTFDYSAEVASNAVPKFMANIKGLQKDVLDAYRVYFQQECMGTPNLPIVSADDVSAVQISPVSEEATYKEYQQFVMCIIAQAFNIPAEKVGVTKSNDRSKTTEIDETLIAETITPYLNVLVAGINRTLAICGYDFITASAVYQETENQRTTNLSLIKQQWTGDMITYNEMRVLMGYPVTTAEYGNELYSEFKARLNAQYAGLSLQLDNDNATKTDVEKEKTSEDKGGES